MFLALDLNGLRKREQHGLLGGFSGSYEMDALLSSFLEG